MPSGRQARERRDRGANITHPTEEGILDKSLIETDPSVEELRRRAELVRAAVTLRVLQKVLTTLLSQPRNELRLKHRGLHKQVTSCEERGQRMVYQALPRDEMLPQLFELFQSVVEDATGKLGSIFLPPAVTGHSPEELKREILGLVKAGNQLCGLDWDEHQWLDYGFVQRFLRGYPFPD